MLRATTFPVRQFAAIRPVRRCGRAAAFSTTPRRRSALENLFNAPVEGVQVASVSPTGIQLVDGLFFSSACIFVGGRALLWKVPSTLWNGWSTEHFELFEVVAPRPEILILGTGATVLAPPSGIRKYIQNLGIGLEVMDTRNAASTYNLLQEEGRRVSAALLPLRDFRSK